MNPTKQYFYAVLLLISAIVISTTPVMVRPPGPLEGSDQFLIPFLSWYYFLALFGSLIWINRIAAKSEPSTKNTLIKIITVTGVIYLVASVIMNYLFMLAF